MRKNRCASLEYLVAKLQVLDDQRPTNIFLESAYFNAVSVRKTSKRHNLKTDASFRFERGTDPEMTVIALKRAALLIQGSSWGRNLFNDL
jgi:phenylalanyl-tRNA synthetase beta subunit